MRIFPHWRSLCIVTYGRLLNIWVFLPLINSIKQIKGRVCQKSQVVRPEGAEAPSPGQRPGCNTSKAKRPVRAEVLIMNAFALTGRIIIISVYPGRCPGLDAIWALPFRFAPATFGSARIV